MKVKPGGQAATKGVQVGWRIKKVGGSPVGLGSDSLLSEAIRLAIQQCVDAGQEFTIDFSTVADVHDGDLVMTFTPGKLGIIYEGNRLTEVRHCSNAQLPARMAYYV